MAAYGASLIADATIERWIGSCNVIEGGPNSRDGRHEFRGAAATPAQRSGQLNSDRHASASASCSGTDFEARNQGSAPAPPRQETSRLYPSTLLSLHGRDNPARREVAPSRRRSCRPCVQNGDLKHGDQRGDHSVHRDPDSPAYGPRFLRCSSNHSIASFCARARASL